MVGHQKSTFFSIYQSVSAAVVRNSRGNLRLTARFWGGFGSGIFQPTGRLISVRSGTFGNGQAVAPMSMSGVHSKAVVNQVCSPLLLLASEAEVPRDFESRGGPSAYCSPRQPGTLQVSVREGSQDERSG